MAIGRPLNLTPNVATKNISVVATAGQTSFTVGNGYRINEIGVYRNGTRLVDGRDFTATDGVIVTLLSAATVGDVLEFAIFDSFNASAAVNTSGDSTINGNLTATSFIGDVTGNAAGLTGSPDITINNLVGVAATFSGNVSVGGTLTYEDVTNVDSVGIVTAGKGLRATTGGLIVTAGVSTFTGAADFNGALDVDGHTELDDLNVSGVSTFTGAADFNGAIDVDGHTELDNLNVSGVSTFAGWVTSNDRFYVPSPGTGNNSVYLGHPVIGGVVYNYLSLDTSSNLVAGITNAGAATFKGIDLDGPYKQTVKTIAQSGTPTVDLSLGNYFTLTQNAAVTQWTFSNPPASRSFSFVVELANGGHATAWSLASGTVKWPADTAPTLAASKTHLIIFVTDDGGTTYRASSIVDYTT